MKVIYGVALWLSFPVFVFAQAIDNTQSYKNINTDSYFRIIYENDFFTQADIYYTQGINLELVAPWVRKFPLSKLLINPDYSYKRYGITVEHDAYTPTNISPTKILYGDRPFTAALFLKTFCIETDPEYKQRFSSTLSTGVLGQAAFGAEMQTGIHHALHDLPPHGWPNQIHNDAVLNYEVGYEKQLVAMPKYFLLDADGKATAGTLSDKAGVGLTAMAGYFDNPFSADIVRRKGARIYAYDHADAFAIGYDATMQGGLFNHTSPYTISASNIQRAVVENRFGFVFNYHKLYVAYFQTFLSSEFKGGADHRWGGIEIAFGL